MYVDVPISIGELADKCTILDIKARKVSDIVKKALVQEECARLKVLVPKFEGNQIAIVSELSKTNEQLWDMENQIRDAHAIAAMYPLSIMKLTRVVELSAQIIELNLYRSELKAKLDQAFGSPGEVKSYQGK